MPAPDITFTVSGNKVSSVSGFDHISVSFFADIAYTECEIRATRVKDAYGKGVGRLIAAFSTTPANTTRTFEVYDTDLLSGDGDYRISIYAESEDGGWNDNHSILPSSAGGLVTSEGQEFLCMR